MRSTISKILGEDARPSVSLPNFDASILDNVPEEKESDYYSKCDNILEPCYDTFWYEETGPDELVHLVELAASGKIYAINTDDVEFLRYLTVPVDQWNLAVKQCKKILR